MLLIPTSFDKQALRFADFKHAFGLEREFEEHYRRSVLEPQAHRLLPAKFSG